MRKQGRDEEKVRTLMLAAEDKLGESREEAGGMHRKKDSSLERALEPVMKYCQIAPSAGAASWRRYYRRLRCR